MQNTSTQDNLIDASALQMQWREIGPKTFASHAEHVANLGSLQPDASIDGITLFLPPNVYHPGIGLSSRFLVDAVLPDAVRGKVLDLGCGSGFVGISVYRPGVDLVLADIADAALQSARENLRRLAIPGQVLASDLFSSFEGQQFDAILFNPPLFDKQVEHAAEIALCDPAGDLLSRFLLQAPHHLSANGAIYFVGSNLMNQRALLDGLQGYHHQIISTSYCRISEVWRWAIRAAPKQTANAFPGAAPGSAQFIM
ncbi:MAG: methyltransferase [Janthinobacterium lividum]